MRFLVEITEFKRRLDDLFRDVDLAELEEIIDLSLSILEDEAMEGEEENNPELVDHLASATSYAEDLQSTLEWLRLSLQDLDKEINGL